MDWMAVNRESNQGEQTQHREEIKAMRCDPLVVAGGAVVAPRQWIENDRPGE